MTNKSILAYSNGIVSDFTCMEFFKRAFQAGSMNVRTNGGTLSRLDKVDIPPVLSNPFFIANAESWTDAYSLTIPEETMIEEPIEIILDQTAENAMLYLSIRVGQGSRMSFVERGDVKGYRGVIVDVTVEEGAVVEYTILQSLHCAGYLISLHRGDVRRDATVRWHDIQMGGTMVKSDILTTLAGEGAVGETRGLFCGRGEQAYDMYHNTLHAFPRTRSRMETKGLLTGAAQAVYRGCVQIPSGSFGCKGEEREDTLLLSEDARVAAIPDLDIANNDVQCSHAVTATRLNEEKIFYLQSRGMDISSVRRTLSQAHAATIIDGLTESIRDEVAQKFDQYVF